MFDTILAGTKELLVNFKATVNGVDMARRVCGGMPFYPNFSDDLPFLLTMCPVKAGEQLVTPYGDTYHRTYTPLPFIRRHVTHPVTWELVWYLLDTVRREGVHIVDMGERLFNIPDTLPEFQSKMGKRRWSYGWAVDGGYIYLDQPETLYTWRTGARAFDADGWLAQRPSGLG